MRRKCKHLVGLGVIAVLAATTNARADLLGWWNFEDGDGSEVVADLSGRGNDGIPSDAFTFSPDGFRGAAGDFGDFGNGAFVSIPAAAEGAFDSIVKSQQATIAFWMNRQGKDAANQWTFILDGGSDSSDSTIGRQLASHAGWGGGNGTLYFDTGGCCGDNQRINKAMVLNDVAFGQDEEWHHLAYVRDVDDTYVYVDGELFHSSIAQTGEDAITSPVAPIMQVTIGANATSGGSQAGLIDEFSIWDEALSQDRIKGLMCNCHVPPGNGADFNMDGEITAADYDILLRNYGEIFAFGESAHKGDYNGDLAVNMSDFFQFRGDYLAAQAGASAVPEPLGVALFGIAAMVLGCSRGRRYTDFI